MKILINRTDAIGDMVLTLPIVQVLSREFGEEVEIHVIVRSYVAPILQNHPKIKKIHIFDGNLKTLKQMFKFEGFSHYLYVGGSHKVSCAAFLTAVPFRFGLKSRLPSFLFLNKGIRQTRGNGIKSEVDLNLELLLPLNLNDYSWKSGELLYLSNEEKLKYSDRQKFIVVHPWMNNNSCNWTIKNYTELIEKLIELNFRVVVSYTSKEKSRLSNLKLKKNDLLSFHQGDLKGLRDSMSLFYSASLFVGPSTGPLHLASAQGVSTISIFSPIATQSAKRWGPVGKKDKNVIFTPTIACKQKRRCLKNECSLFDCMDTIKVNDVIDKIKGMLL